MHMIVPIDVTDAILVDCNIPETDYAPWNSGATYGLGDRRIVVATHSVYQSIQAGNTNHDPVVDSALETPLWWVRVGATNRYKAFDDVINDQASAAGNITYELDVVSRCDGIALFNLGAASVRVQVSDPLAVRRNLFEATDDMSDPIWQPLSLATYVGTAEAPDGTMDAFEFNFPSSGAFIRQVLSAPVSGDVVVSSWVRSDTVTAMRFDGAGGNYIDVPISNVWTRVSDTEFSVPISITSFRPGVGQSGNITFYRPQIEYGSVPTEYQEIDTSGVVTSPAYDETRDLQDYSGIDSHWDYMFAPIIRNDTALFTDVPAFSGATVQIEIGSEGTVRVGEIALGMNYTLGESLAEPTVGIEDYSRKERDTFGNALIIERAFADTVNFNFAIQGIKAGYIQRLLADRRARPTVYHTGAESEFFGTLIYGFYKDFSIPVKHRDIATATMEVEGLT